MTERNQFNENANTVDQVNVPDSIYNELLNRSNENSSIPGSTSNSSGSDLLTANSKLIENNILPDLQISSGTVNGDRLPSSTGSSKGIEFSNPTTEGDPSAKPLTGARRNIWTADGRHAYVETDGNGGVRKTTTLDGSISTRDGELMPQWKFPWDKTSYIVGTNTDGDVETRRDDGSGTLHRSDGSKIERDNQGRVTEVNYANGQKRSFKYGDKGSQPTEFTDPDGNRYKYEDGKYQQYVDGYRNGSSLDGVPVIEADGTYRYANKYGDVTTYNPDGSKVTVAKDDKLYITDKTGKQSRIETDETGKRYLLTGNDIRGKEVQVDDIGNYREIDPHHPNGGTWHKLDGSTVALDEKGRVTQVNAPGRNGLDRQFIYDGAGNITAVSDTKGGAWVRNADGVFEEYDKNGLKTGKGTPPNTKVEVDTQGNQIWITGDKTRKVEWTDGRTTEDIVD